MSARLCPHCNVMSNFQNSASSPGHWGPPGKNVTSRIDIYQCHNCNGLIALREDLIDNIWAEMGIFPASIPTLDKAVPLSVAQDFVSGVNCLSIKETKAAAAMFRRSLQQLAINMNAKGNTLFDQLNWLQLNANLPASIIDWAHEIRFWGNEGAHPNTDGLDEITYEEAGKIRDFVENVFDWVYIMPSRVAESRGSRASRNANP